jgi:hypothetical protein
VCRAAGQPRARQAAAGIRCGRPVRSLAFAPTVRLHARAWDLLGFPSIC